MHIFKSDQTGTYHVQFSSDHGEQTVDTGAKTLVEAKERCALAKIEELEKAAAVGRLTAETIAMLGAGQRVTVNQAVDQYEAWSKIERAPKTTLSSLAILRKFVREAGVGEMAPGQVTAKHTTAFVNRDELKLTTRKVVRAGLRSFFDFCNHKGWLISNPAGHIPIAYSEMPLEKKERKTKELFSPVEIEFLIGRLEGFWRAAVILSSELGLRLSDVCNLEWKSFDFKKGVLTLWMEKTNERLSIPMTQKVKRLAVALEQADKRWVFPEQRDTWARAQSTLSHQFRRICESLGMDGKSFHCLRASYATHEYLRAVERDGAMVEVAGKLGHKSAKTTSKHYVKASS